MSLSWIEDSILEEIVTHRFKKSVEKIEETDLEILRTDPTLTVIQSTMLGLDQKQIDEIYKTISLTKTLQNAIGLFHQDVLGNIEGFESLGPSQGVFDIQSVKPLDLADGKKMIGEVKMRFNTIKASDEANLWEKLKDQVKSRGLQDYTAYLIQIVPKNGQSYDRPWRVSGRTPQNYVRCIDGTTAYYYATGIETALLDLLHELPSVLYRAFPQLKDVKRLSETDFRQVIDNAASKSIPPTPAKVRE